MRKQSHFTGQSIILCIRRLIEITKHQRKPHFSPLIICPFFSDHINIRRDILAHKIDDTIIPFTQSIFYLPVKRNYFLIGCISEQPHILYYILKKRALEYVSVSIPVRKPIQNNLLKRLTRYTVIVNLILFQIFMKAGNIRNDLRIADDHMITFLDAFLLNYSADSAILFKYFIIFFASHISAPRKFYRRIISFTYSLIIRMPVCHFPYKRTFTTTLQTFYKIIHPILLVSFIRSWSPIAHFPFLT